MKFFRYIILYTAFALLFFQAKAQDHILSGYIYDSQTRQPLTGASIKTARNELIAQSGRNGYFEISSVQPENVIHIIFTGYKTQVVRLNDHDTNLNIQLEADAVSLNEVRVIGYSGNQSKRETAGSVALITSQDINRGNAVSFQPALNAIPGVRMEQSTLSESRISIRGNGVRASFGIRNIKIYLNDIPVTEADGTTRIEALDVNGIGRAEIIKGPASSIYGAGTGGVINFQLQRSPYQEQSIEVSGLSGAFNLSRLATTYRSGGDKLNSYASYGWQEYKGYREHSNDMRRFITGNFQLFPTDRRIITLLINRTTQHSQIPGPLTMDQAAVDPVQANSTNLDKAAARYQNWTRIGLGQQYRFNDRFSNSSSIFTYFYDLNHPLPFAYIRNYYQSYGGRTRFTYDPGFKTLPTKFIAGAEFNEGLTKGVQYVNNQGVEGAINSNIDYRNTLYSLFYQSETSFGTKTALTLGLSYNSLSYNVHDYLKPERSGIKKFDPQVTPRIALSHNLSKYLSLHASISSGFSPPSSSEIANADGSINPVLQAEKGINYEINVKGSLLRRGLEYDLALFKMDMKGELIGQSLQPGITVYNNSGKTSHKGIELALSYQVFKPEDQGRIVSLRPFAALTWSDFRFEDYKILNAQNQVTASYDGNRLTGIAPWVINAGIDLEARSGFYFYGSYFYSDKLPVNDANSVYNASYQVLNSKLGYKKLVSRSFEVNIYGGLDNILNQNYNSIVTLNAVGFGGAQAAYFNPSPDRNGYGGLSFKYLF